MVRLVGEDRSEKKVIDDIAQYGWHCVHIQAEGKLVEYSFTVGLFKTYKHPELIVFGLPYKVSHQILTTVAEAAQSGAPLDLGKPCDALLNGYSCWFAEVPKSQYYEHVGYARWYYEGNSFPLQQIVWPSRSGYFPWHPLATPEFKRSQPVIALGAGNT